MTNVHPSFTPGTAISDPIAAPRHAARIAGADGRGLYRDDDLPTFGRTSELDTILQEATKAADTYDRLGRAWNVARDAVQQAEREHSASIDTWVRRGGEGKPPDRKAIDRAQTELEEAGARLVSAARHAQMTGNVAREAVEAYRTEWRDTLAERVTEAREQAATALSEAQEAVRLACQPAQEAVDVLWSALTDAEAILGTQAGPAPKLADLALSVALPDAPEPEPATFVVSTVEGPGFGTKPMEYSGLHGQNVRQAEDYASSDGEYFLREASR